MKYVLMAIIRFYQKYISRFTPPTCRFYPTCSQYGVEAIQRFGAWKGGWLTVKRVLKCQPLHPGGFDPVPESDCCRHRKRKTAADNSEVF
ncbi:hypothetical protein SAMN05421736_12511 [Evansella caseinilytica]|uniref:Putative membrane protein insertion efficiency factor n=1 Tax=Evansella caseinilytica TaxID=1503961 RepID=A0A1H3URH6_9BACI|nr:membrane protein insertion efficiency factor YidD [Evansella caseinilytica]SDZ65080.1 hypothetical protein SAMN05421736_12511 [Evansella caseinilytica]